MNGELRLNSENYGQFDSDRLDRWVQSAECGSLPAALGALTDEKSVKILLSKEKQAIGTIIEYRDLMMTYTCAMKEVLTKFDVLSTEFKVRYQRNPISSMSSRLKKTASIAEKLAKRDITFTVENIEQHLHDVAGVRVICAYIDDIYMIADAFLSQDDVTLIEKKDYIASPKENGYRSLHLIISIPVFFAKQKRDMQVEVQIRTMAMDFWASLEHQLRYKNDLSCCNDLAVRLQNCADVISRTDEEMLYIRRKIEQMESSSSKEEELLEKISKLDLRME
ncbi:MAG: GTP pyrophosphokinase family protein [Clostridia bacterium]|nr:GTP pyrophosphokinase family protein [Clostridia bacterium]